MTTEELFLRYVEETDILNAEKSVFVTIYGSRVSGDYKDSSDLDVFVVVPGEEWCYHKEKRLIDGIPVETLFMDRNTMMKILVKEYWNDSTFLESIFTYGDVKRDLYGIQLAVIDEISKLKEQEKTGTEFCWEEDLDRCLYMYRHTDGNEKKRHYYDFINALRIMYHYMHNYSEVVEWKFYQLYTNKEKAKRYCLELPDDEFIDAILNAVNPDDMDESLENLFHFVGYTDYEKMNRRVRFHDKWKKCLSKHDTEKKLIHLGKNIEAVEGKLLTESIDADSCYFYLLNYIDNDIWYIGPKDRTEFDEVFKRALDAEGAEERIRVLEELLHILDNNYNFDHDDYYL